MAQSYWDVIQITLVYYLVPKGVIGLTKCLVCWHNDQYFVAISGPACEVADYCDELQ